MKNTIITLSLATLLTLSSSAVMADNKYRHYDRGGQDRAKVTWVEPVYNEVRVTTPIEECYETRDYRRGGPQQSYTSTIAGGIIGGVVGNQFGGGNGQTAMTVAGALLGGSVGRDLGSNSNQYRQTDYGYREQCEVRYQDRYEQRVEGYEVGYRYKGREYSTFMDHHPGKFIPVEVTAKPSRRYY